MPAVATARNTLSFGTILAALTWAAPSLAAVESPTVGSNLVTIFVTSHLPRPDRVGDSELRLEATAASSRSSEVDLPFWLACDAPSGSWGMRGCLLTPQKGSGPCRSWTGSSRVESPVSLRCGEQPDGVAHPNEGGGQGHVLGPHHGVPVEHSAQGLATGPVDLRPVD